MWDYLILTASNALQAAAYQSQLELRQRLGLLPQVRQTMVVADIDGKRIGSGGSTLYCLQRVMEATGTLRGLRILIVHAGGDSRRLPAYGPCGKIFVPVPASSNAALPTALFDLLTPQFLSLTGQIVVAAGDALILFDAAAADFSRPGITALGCYAAPEEAARHGVFCVGADGAARKFLQKPSLEEQQASGAMRDGRTALDIGVMSMDAASAEALLQAFGASYVTEGVDLYREICCALGSEATWQHYLEAVRSNGSHWSETALAPVYAALHELPFFVSLLPDCRFLHFGSTKQLIQSGLALAPQASDLLILNSEVQAPVTGSHSWVEGCRIHAPLHLGGWNVVVGVDIEEPLTLPPNACLDVLRGGNGEWFIRCYGIEDAFKDATFCGRSLTAWLNAVGAPPEEIWARGGEHSLWNARVFPAEASTSRYSIWLWMYAPETATAAQKQAFRTARRFSAAEIAWLADQDAFHERRMRIVVQ